MCLVIWSLVGSVCFGKIGVSGRLMLVGMGRKLKFFFFGCESGLVILMIGIVLEWFMCVIFYFIVW